MFTAIFFPHHPRKSLGPLPHDILPPYNPCSQFYQYRLAFPYLELSISGAYCMYTFSCFTMLCYLLLYSNELCIWLYTLLFKVSSHLGHHRALRTLCCAIQIVLIGFQDIILQNIQTAPVTQYLYI